MQTHFHFCCYFPLCSWSVNSKITNATTKAKPIRGSLSVGKILMSLALLRLFSGLRHFSVNIIWLRPMGHLELFICFHRRSSALCVNNIYYAGLFGQFVAHNFVVIKTANSAIRVNWHWQLQFSGPFLIFLTFAGVFVRVWLRMYS